MSNLCKNVKASLNDVYHTSFYLYNQKKKKKNPYTRLASREAMIN